MKKILFLFSMLAMTTSLTAQGDRWEAKADRFAEKAERWGEDIERQAERTAARWETRAGQFADRWERNRGRNHSIRVDGYGHTFVLPDCPEVAFLGIETMEISLEKAKKLGFENSYGSYVSKVMANSAAKVAGLQPFDYIYGVDEQRASDNQGLSDMLEDFEPGNEVTLHFIRKGEKMNVKVKLTDSEDYDYEGEENERAFLGVSPSGEEEGDDMDGVSVEVVEKSTAEEMGLKEGDIITAINGFPVLDWDDVTTCISNTNPGEPIEVKFKREGNEMAAKGTIKSYTEVYPEGDSGNWNIDVDWEEVEGAVEGALMDVDEALDLDGLLQNDNRAFMGIYTEMISEEKAEKLGFDNPYGTYVTGVMANSGADKAGLKPFDYLFGIDEYRAGEDQSLGAVLKKYKPGDKATVHFIRKGKKSSTDLTFTKPSEVKKTERNSCEDPFFGVMQDMDSDEDDGVPVTPVKGSTAADLGLQPGDVITHLNGYKIVDWVDITTAIEMLKPGETISVDYVRDGKTLKGSKVIRSYAETKNCPNCDCGDKEIVIINTVPGSDTKTIWNIKPRTTNSTTPSTPRMNINEAKVAMENVTSEESGTLQGKGVQMPATSNLTVENLKMSPNPTTGTFGLDFNLPTSGNTIVRVFNLSGRTLYEYDLGTFSGKFSDSVDISQNGPGNYYLQVTQDGKVFTKKIVLSKG
ncbi:MAG: PDZ domain-containing protein [Bacteroidetes bacterium]|nr:PDZ domain-containing protein [Bacteroidota bacterium]